MHCHVCNWGGDYYDLQDILNGKEPRVTGTVRQSQVVTRPKAKKMKSTGTIETTYPYRDEDSKLLYETVRKKNPKQTASGRRCVMFSALGQQSLEVFLRVLHKRPCSLS